MSKVEIDEEKDVGFKLEQEETSQIETEVPSKKATEHFENIQQIVEEVIAKEMKTVDQKIRSAIKDALTEVFGEFLADSNEPEDSNEPVPEEQPKCPANPKWLKAMFSILPEDVLKHSKLWKYRHCVKDFE